MKVFTVGLDQKPPVEETKANPEKSSASPPPGYSTESRIPLPLGPELPRPPLPPQPIIVRKSRGYKGILLVMLAVFLMAAFALTLSEMAYNRQREENFFKLRWAELKHRMGYTNDGPFDYYHRAASSIGEKFDRLLSLARSNELPQSLSVEQETTTSSTAAPTPEPIVAIDTFPMAPSALKSSSASSSSSSQQNSIEVEPPQPLPLLGPLGMQNMRDARLQFLRNILQKIKQHAEDIGFDGTMQVSIIEVEPQNGADSNNNNDQPQQQENNNNNWAQRSLLLPQFASLPQLSLAYPQHFFPHPRPLIDDFKSSRSFLDGFGEFHPPTNFMQNNQVMEPEERPRMMFGPWAQQQQMPNMPNEFPAQHQQQNGPDFMESMRWPRVHPFLRPQQQQQQSQPSSSDMLIFHPMFPQQLNLRFPPIQPPQFVGNEWAAQQQQAQQPQAAALPRPSAFDRWAGGSSPQLMFQHQPSMMMLGQQAEQQQQQQAHPPAQMPQHQQIQIDFPEVKLPPPIVNNDNTADEDNADTANNNKFPMGPPSTSQPQIQAQQQPEEPPRWAMPKWGSSNDKEDNNNNGAGKLLGSAGPPSVQPSSVGGSAASDIVKFPQVTVVEPAKNVADNEDVPTVSGVPPPSQQQLVTTAEGEKKEPEDVVEVEAPQPIVPQTQQPQQAEAKPEQDQQQVPAEQLQQQQQQSQSSGSASPQQQQQFQQKWFPEVPSVFFQRDNSSEEIEKTEKVFESMVENMKRMIGNMFKMDDSSSTEIVQVDDPNGGTGGSSSSNNDDAGAVNVPKPAVADVEQQPEHEQLEQQQQPPRQPHLVVD